MNGTTAPRPRPAAVVELAVRLVGSPWPRTEAHRVTWFERHRLAADPAAPGEFAFGDDRGASYQTPGPALLDGTPIGWRTFDGEFVGVSWVLWPGLSAAALRVAAVDLRAGFRRAFGPPVEESDGTGQAGEPGDGFTALWQAGGRTIDLYLHPAGRPPGRPGPDEIPAAVQLRIEHSARSGAPERWDRQRSNGQDPPH